VQQGFLNRYDARSGSGANAPDPLCDFYEACETFLLKVARMAVFKTVTARISCLR